MRLKSIKFLKVGDKIYRDGKAVEIIEVVPENDFIVYKDVKENKEHFTTGEAFFSKEIRG